MGTLLCRCVEVHIAIELSFDVVSGVGSGIHVLDGSPRVSRGRGCFWHGFWHFSAFFDLYFTMATGRTATRVQKVDNISLRGIYH